MRERITKADLSSIYAPKVSLQRAQFNEAKLESANLVAAGKVALYRVDLKVTFVLD